MSLEYTYEARVHNNVSLCNTNEDSKSRIRLPAHCLPPEQPLPTCAALQIVNYKNRSRAGLGGYTLGQTVAAKLGPKRKEEATSSQARAYAERPNCAEGLEGPSRPFNPVRTSRAVGMSTCWFVGSYVPFRTLPMNVATVPLRSVCTPSI